MIFEVLFYVGITVLVGYLSNKFYFSGGKCVSKNRVDGKIVIITGANTGIGYETALDLARRGAHVIIACRDMKKAEKAAYTIKTETNNNNVDTEYLDLSDLDTVRSFAKKFLSKFDRLDILINNAGIMICPNWRTKQGFEMQIGVNHLGHFLLTNLFLDVLKKSSPSRIINVSSRAHYDFGMNWDDFNWEKSYSPIKAYSQSKTANILFTKELAKRLQGTGVTAVSLHPGAVRTELTRYMGESLFSLFPVVMNLIFPIWLVLSKSCKEGAQTTLHCCLDDDMPQYSGCYFSDCKLKKPSEQSRNHEYAAKLWEKSAKMVGLTE